MCRKFVKRSTFFMYSLRLYTWSYALTRKKYVSSSYSLFLDFSVLSQITSKSLAPSARDYIQLWYYQKPATFSVLAAFLHSNPLTYNMLRLFLDWERVFWNKCISQGVCFIHSKSWRWQQKAIQMQLLTCLYVLEWHWCVYQKKYWYWKNSL